jgi:hypothetical protein
MLTPEKVEKLAAATQGTITNVSADRTQFRVEFPISTRAASFYDEIATAMRSTSGVDYEGGYGCIVLVTLPEPKEVP